MVCRAKQVWGTEDSIERGQVGDLASSGICVLKEKNLCLHLSCATKMDRKTKRKQSLLQFAYGEVNIKKASVSHRFGLLVGKGRRPRSS